MAYTNRCSFCGKPGYNIFVDHPSCYDLAYGLVWSDIVAGLCGPDSSGLPLDVDYQP